MIAFRLPRGTPCDVRRVGEWKWKPHVASMQSLLANRVLYNESLHWVFAHDGWEVRVSVQLLEREVAEPFDPTVHHAITGSREGITEAQEKALRDHFNVWLVYALQLPLHLF